MWNKFHRVLLIYFNTIGLMSLKSSSRNGLIILKNSNFYALLNCLKVILLLYYKNSIFKLLAESYSIGPEIKFSKFTDTTFYLNGEIIVLSSLVNIIVQLWRKEDILNLLNDFSKYKNVSIKTFNMEKSFYEEFRRKCIKDCLLLIIAFGTVFFFDYFSTMYHNWFSLMCYVLYILPEIVNISMIVLIYIATQFVVSSQKILNSHLSKRFNKNYIEQYAIHTKNNYYILRQILKIMNIQCLFVTIYLFMEALVQVS